MKTFISVDGLLRLANSHPQYERLQPFSLPTGYRVIVTRSGKTFTGECLKDEAQRMRAASDVWDAWPDKMMRITATRRAIESAFPEFIAQGVK